MAVRRGHVMALWGHVNGGRGVNEADEGAEAAEKAEEDRTEGEKKRTVSGMFKLIATPTGSLSPDGVPHIAVEVVIAGHEQPARLAEGH